MPGLSLITEIIQALDEHTSRATGRIVNALIGLGLENLGHQRDNRTICIELLRCITGIVGELSNQVLISLAHLIGRAGLKGKIIAREILNQGSDDAVRHFGLIRPPVLGAEDAFQSANDSPINFLTRISLLNSDEGFHEFLANVLGNFANIVPVSSLWDFNSQVLDLHAGIFLATFA